MGVNMKADLHVHSSYSDGNMSVIEIAEYAKSKKIDVVAITDHDNLKSSEDISRLNSEVLLLVGVELSTYYNNENIHILGYFYNNKITTKEIQEYLNKLRINRDKRINEIIDKLKKFYNINIDYESINKFADGSIGRPHVAKAIVEKYGCTYDEAFDRYIGNNAKAYVPTTNFNTKDAIDFLHRNNAIAVIAHPKHIKKNNVIDIISLGVDGIEVYYPEHDLNDTKKYLELSKEYNLLVTGGSDFHGVDIKDDLGTSLVKYNYLDRFLSKLNINKKEES